MAEYSPEISKLFKSGKNKEIRLAVKKITSQGGWVGRPTSSGHVLLKHESGYTTTISPHPSDRRTVQNTICDLRRAYQETSVHGPK